MAELEDVEVNTDMIEELRIQSDEHVSTTKERVQKAANEEQDKNLRNLSDQLNERMQQMEKVM